MSDRPPGAASESLYDSDMDDFATVVDASAYEGPKVPDYPPIGTFGRYEILGRLASGGMAEIFLARDRIGSSMVQHLVIKRVLPHMADNEQFIEMFLDEGRIANRLYHPNICHVYESGEVESAYFMAMEWVHGPPLRRVIRRASERGRVPIPIAVKIISHVAEGLHYAHNAKGEGGKALNIVHRDVSPHNIMLSWTGAVKLLDFGIAKAATQEAHTQAGTVKGKYAYMSPEQCRSQEVDARADVFALGICLYEIVTGKPLYHRDTVLNTMQAIVYDDVPSVRAADESLPHELDRIVQKALQKDPAHRFQSAREMHDALERFLAMRGEVVDPTRIADFLGVMFDEEDKAPLSAPGRQTGSFGQLTPSGSFGPFGGGPRHLERVEMDPMPSVTPTPHAAQVIAPPSAIDTARLTAAELGKPRLPVWAAFGLGLVVAIVVTTLAVAFLL